MDDSFDQLSPRGIPKLAPSTSSDNLSTPKCKRPRMAFGSHVRVLKTHGVTPEPEFNKMTDDQVKGELAKHGLRPMGRKNAVKLLQQIYESTHPTVDPDEAQKAVSSNSAEEESSDGAQDDHSADENLEESFVFDGDLPKDLDGMQRALVTWLREPDQTEILDHLLQLKPVSFQELYLRIKRADSAVCKMSRKALQTILDRLSVFYSLPNTRFRRGK